MEVYVQEWIESALNGDMKDFFRLLTFYQKRLYEFARRTIGIPADAEEQVQECWLECFVNLPALKDPARFENWFYLLARDMLNRYFREKGRIAELLPVIKHAFPQFPPAEPVWDEYGRALKSALARLTPAQAEVLRLRFYMGLSYREVGLSGVMTMQQVRSRLYEASVVLGEEFPKLFEDDNSVRLGLKGQKARLMRRVERIRTGAPVVGALPLETQVELCRQVEAEAGPDTGLLRALGKVKGGKEFVQDYAAGLTLRDLTRIYKYSRNLQEWMIRNLDEKEAVLTATLSPRTFVFAEMIGLEPAVVQFVLKKLRAETLLAAVIACPVELKSFLLGFLPEDKRNKLLCKLPEIDTELRATEMAQFEFLQIIENLRQEGRLRVELPDGENGPQRIYLQSAGK